jgi:ring-1,2-phenylacetyl-CoA epoxidase subunit PaaC
VIATADVATYALRLGDDALVLAQRLGEWSARAPDLEEDVALTNIALDLLGQARSLLTYAGSFYGRTEDDLAYLRDEREFRNVQLVELPNGDFATTIARQLLFATYQGLLYRDLAGSADDTLAGVAGKAVKEVAYHRDHALQWTLRLGDGTSESHRRMQDGLDGVWPYVDDLFDTDDLVRRLSEAGVAVDMADLRPEWTELVVPVLAEATLTVPEVPARITGGRQGLHTESFGYLLAELQHLHRSHPGARW